MATQVVSRDGRITLTLEATCIRVLEKRIKQASARYSDIRMEYLVDIRVTKGTVPYWPFLAFVTLVVVDMVMWFDGRLALMGVLGFIIISMILRTSSLVVTSVGPPGGIDRETSNLAVPLRGSSSARAEADRFVRAVKQAKSELDVREQELEAQAPSLPESRPTHGVDLGREVGRGGMATVYVARDRRLGREVAVKVLHENLLADREAVARFEREARMVASLEHPNILGIYGVEDLEDGRIGLVMPFVRGGTLADLLKRSGDGLPVEEVIRITREVLRGLSYAHARGVVHRDIKPGNIFLESDTGRVLVADFGIARAAGAHTALTQTGSSMGTPNYMAPEQIDSVSQVDGRADVYAVGMVMWEMLTGEQPWSGETLFNVIFKQKTEDLPSPGHIRPDLPEHVIDVWRAATRKDREARWDSAEAMLGALAQPEGVQDRSTKRSDEGIDSQDSHLAGRGRRFDRGPSSPPDSNAPTQRWDG